MHHGIPHMPAARQAHACRSRILEGGAPFRIRQTAAETGNRWLRSPAAVFPQSMLLIARWDCSKAPMPYRIALRGFSPSASSRAGSSSSKEASFYVGLLACAMWKVRKSRFPRPSRLPASHPTFPGYRLRNPQWPASADGCSAHRAHSGGTARDSHPVPFYAARMMPIEISTAKSLRLTCKQPRIVLVVAY